ncbi:hypothetical protein [Dyella acidisoli]|uniref:hypothetical protein n=1 Tax=Dyella acidisoli TaxID=1867834 RepID=UPI0024E0B9E6|nr:hypothetical protein [Dyella acidisoli]
MKLRNLCVPLLVACALSSAVQATTFSASGVISFHGSVSRSTSIPVATEVLSPIDLATTRTIESLAQSRARLSSDLLDYFAQYAKPDSKVVSVVYQ